MLTFQSLKPEELPFLRSYMAAQSADRPLRVSDSTVGAAFMWRRFLHTAWAANAGMLIFCITLGNGDKYFTFPIGSGDPAPALDALESYCAENALPLRFSGVPQPALELLTARYGADCRCAEWRDSADYLYTAETFLSFPGRHLSGQRNHVRQFYRAHPAAVFAPLTAADLPDAIAFIEAFNARHDAEGKRGTIEMEEGLRSCELLQYLMPLGLAGGCLKEEGRLLAVTAGEILGDTLYVHIEKADTRCPGIYQAVSQAFARHMVTAGVDYINREDDAGDPGLRRSKLSYRPCALISKYSVTVTSKG